MKSLAIAKSRFRRTVWLLAIFSFMVNILMLTMPLYMLQVYDRILPSRSLDTLTFLTVIAMAALVVLGALEAVRGMLAARAAARLEAELGADALRASLHMGQSSGGEVQPMRELAGVRGYISSRAIFAVLDLPFSPLFIGLLYFIHPSLFWLTVAGAVVLVLLAMLNQAVTSSKNVEATQKQAVAFQMAGALSQNNESLRAMGMTSNGITSWGASNAESMISQGVVDTRNSILSGLSRTIRMMLQIGIMGLGAWLVLQDEMTAGMIFAASIISGKGLQPLDQVIASWKQSIGAWRSWKSLSSVLKAMPDEQERTRMPELKGALSMESVLVLPPRGVAADPIINRVSFTIEPGDIVGLVGPSGSGKSTLARLMVGAQIPDQGVVRIDGGELRHWDPEQLGRDIGYLSQEVRLLPGTVKQNIARLEPEPDDEKVLEAARRAQVHELIQGLPNGYDTFVGPGGFTPSVGQRQRIALARAFYGNPQLLVLDEPNANLDEDGDMALNLAIKEARNSGSTLILVSQRKEVLMSLDKILRMHSGKMDFYGTREQFVEALMKVRQQRQGGPGGPPAAQAPGPRPPTGPAGMNIPQQPAPRDNPYKPFPAAKTPRRRKPKGDGEET